jgi:hypothetical protein
VVGRVGYPAKKCRVISSRRSLDGPLNSPFVGAIPCGRPLQIRRSLAVARYKSGDPLRSPATNQAIPCRRPLQIRRSLAVARYKSGDPLPSPATNQAIPCHRPLQIRRSLAVAHYKSGDPLPSPATNQAIPRGRPLQIRRFLAVARYKSGDPLPSPATNQAIPCRRPLQMTIWENDVQTIRWSPKSVVRLRKPTRPHQTQPSGAIPTYSCKITIRRVPATPFRLRISTT